MPLKPSNAFSDTNPDVYLIHGWGMHSGMWGQLPSWLHAHGYRPHLIDLPGHGGTPPLAQTDLTELTRSLAERINGPACLIGWSLGGIAAMKFAADFPDRVTRLVLTGVSPCFVERPDWPHGMDMNTFSDFVTQVRADPKRTLNGFLGLQVQGSHHERLTLRELRRLLDETPMALTTSLLAGLDILGDNDLRTMLARIEVPVEIIHGALDKLVPAVAAEALATGIPNACLTLIDGAGHAPFLSHPDAFYTALGDPDV